MRSFVGGLELIVSQLKSGEPEVLAAVCAALSVISLDQENLAIITDHGIIPMFVDLVHTTDEVLQNSFAMNYFQFKMKLKILLDYQVLRQYLAQAIAYSCSWGTNRKDLGRLGAITPLVAYMMDGSPAVQCTTALALYHLSENAFNCITMHESGVVPFLLRAVAATDEKLQEAAAGCLSNIRRLALEAETFHLVNKGFKGDDDDESTVASSVRCNN